LKVQSMFSGSALICAALLTLSLILSAQTLSAETIPLQQIQIQGPKPISAPVSTLTPKAVPNANLPTPASPVLTEAPPDTAGETVAAPTASYVATAYSLRGKTASGRIANSGLIAADPRVLPLGSRVRLEAGTFSGEYLVADTGTRVRGKRIDIWTPSSHQAMHFGRRLVKLTVLSFGGKRVPKTAATVAPKTATVVATAQ
jgi:3D (Asp-Asp-Asp) domain-containing protein